MFSARILLKFEKTVYYYASQNSHITVREEMCGWKKEFRKRKEWVCGGRNEEKERGKEVLNYRKKGMECT